MFILLRLQRRHLPKSLLLGLSIIEIRHQLFPLKKTLPQNLATNPTLLRQQQRANPSRPRKPAKSLLDATSLWQKKIPLHGNVFKKCGNSLLTHQQPSILSEIDTGLTCVEQQVDDSHARTIITDSVLKNVQWDHPPNFHRRSADDPVLKELIRLTSSTKKKFRGLQKKMTLISHMSTSEERPTTSISSLLTE